jgi:hypothetical protein
MPLHSITSSADVPPDRSFSAKERRTPFDRTNNVEQWLLILDGATHFTFSGNIERPRIAGLLPGMEADPNLTDNHGHIKSAALAFWRWTLLDEQASKEQLTKVLPNSNRSIGVIEHKSVGNSK